ncbi:HisA/HisF-related TIM barrel protein [Paracoccaceae bacterium]|nr:HisA/HisF-related TIM barrel protein [Paracoccaceae bacterium]
MAVEYQDLGVGEILFNNIDLDGFRKGYDLKFLQRTREKLNVPISALGGTNYLDDVAELKREVGLIGVAASTMFLYKGKHDAILVQKPDIALKKL